MQFSKKMSIIAMVVVGALAMEAFWALHRFLLGASNNTPTDAASSVIPKQSNTTLDNDDDDDDDDDSPLSKTLSKDTDCPFRDSPLYRSVYVYPSPQDKQLWKGDILSPQERARQEEYYRTANDTTRTSPPKTFSWPWIGIDRKARTKAQAQYDVVGGKYAQFSTELLVREILTHSDSCLRTYNPETASLFYVPYLPSMEFHKGTTQLGSYKTSPFAQAILDATDGNYDTWEHTFGLTAKYWKRHEGADHILVQSEPLQGYWHKRSQRGNFHYIHTQRQLKAPIVISVELSRTFVETYPHCARKNILMPYPNPDGFWFNGQLDKKSDATFTELNHTFDYHFNANQHQENQEEIIGSAKLWMKTALPAEQKLYMEYQAWKQNPDKKERKESAEDWFFKPRPLALDYFGGEHGSCAMLRTALGQDYECTPAGQFRINHANIFKNYAISYRQATFCPCPGGDSPSAKRMFDALHAGCIPVVLSHDYVWPFTNEFDLAANTTTTNNHESQSLPLSPLLNAEDFSVRLHVGGYNESYFNSSCLVRPAMLDRDPSTLSEAANLLAFLESIPKEEILRLRRGAKRASQIYSYYRRRPDLKRNPLQEGILPDGGAAHSLVQALAERAGGSLWQACQAELNELGRVHQERNTTLEEVTTFKC